MGTELYLGSMNHIEPKTIDAVGTTCEILELLRDHGKLGVTELANEVGMTKSGVYNHLVTLREQQFVVKEDDAYRLSYRHLGFANSAKNHIDYLESIEDELEEIADETGELTKLGVIEHGQLLYVSSFEGDRAVTTSASVGKSEYLHCTALGKAMLAKLPDERVTRILDRHGVPAKTPNTITDVDVLREELATIREQGYAIDDEECVEGIRCIATAITDTDGDVIGGLGITGPASRISDERIENDLAKRIADAVNVIELESKFA